MKEEETIEAVARYLERELDSFYIIGLSGDVGLVKAFNVNPKFKALIIKHNKRFESEYICEDDREKKTTADSNETPEQCIQNLKDILKRQEKKVEVLQMVKELFEGDKEKFKELLDAESHIIKKCETMHKTIRLMEETLKAVNQA